MTTLQHLRYNARRVRQTLQVFDNGPQLLRRLVSRGPEDLVFEIRDLKIACPNTPGARVPVYELFAENEYQLEWFTSDLGDAPVVLDIGAHIGCFSLALTGLHPGAQVQSFEPTPSTAGYLVRNIEANGRGSRVHFHPEAVASTTGSLVFADNGAGSGHNGVLHLGEAGATTIEVPCMSLAAAFDSAGAQVDLVKMDAEGGEYDMILNSPLELWSGVKRVVMEYHALPGHSWAELESFFSEAGLHVVRRDPTSPGLGLAWLSRGPLL